MSVNLKLFVKYAKFGMCYLSSNIRTDMCIITGNKFAKPMQVYYRVSDKCNAKCEMCPQWEMGIAEKKEDWISSERMRQILESLAKWKVLKFGISGGEPLLFKEKVFELLTIANSFGMYSHFATNGWFLNKDIFLEYEDIGGGHISLSLDGDEDVHDELRNKPGLYRQCIKAIKAYKSLNLKKIQMKLNAVISRKNLSSIEKLLNISRENSIPIFFQPVDLYNYDTLLKLNQDEMFHNYPLWIPPSENDLLDGCIQYIKEFKKTLPHLVINTYDNLTLISNYFKMQIQPTQKRRCTVAFDTISILPNGDINICWIGKIGNLKTKDIKEVYYSKEFDMARQKALNCKYPCMLGCLNRPSLRELIKIGLKNTLGS